MIYGDVCTGSNENNYGNDVDDRPQKLSLSLRSTLSGIFLIIEK